ncbi:hypothetical protein C5609_15665 [Pseudomonas putida]|uniref:hypothetical protein n=1 Tax=Pseudomonas putida TaxID=303 RepID=UPI00106FE417|nr:hypothetical protein [Pseudomonas putida]TFF51025.1 hypothetical protein C5609_15665 [Pseudomonas putida]
MSNSISSSVTAHYVSRMLAGEVIAYDKDQPCPTEGDSRFVSIDLQWLIPAFVSRPASVQETIMRGAEEYTAEVCPSGAVPRNILVFINRLLTELDEEQFGCRVERMIIGPCYQHPDFVRCVNEFGAWAREKLP